MKDLNETISIKSTTLHSSPGHYEYLIEVEGFGSTHVVEVLVRRQWSLKKGDITWEWLTLQHQDGSENACRVSTPDSELERRLQIDSDFSRAINPGNFHNFYDHLSTSKARVERKMRKVIMREHCRSALAT